MTLSASILKMAEFDGQAARANYWKSDIKIGDAYSFECGAEHESARLLPLITQLVKCVEALEDCKQIILDRETKADIVQFITVAEVEAVIDSAIYDLTQFVGGRE